MGLIEDSFSNSADKFADKNNRMGLWKVWPNYESRLRKDGERYVLAVEPDESNLPPRVDLAKALEKTNGRVAPGSPEMDLLAQTIERERARKEVWTYWPLVDYPELFLKFARLADDSGLDKGTTADELDTDKNEAIALGWARDYGVLGLTVVEEGGRRDASTRGGKADTVSAFAREAWVANGCLCLYEAVTAEQLDLDLIASYVPLRHRAFFTRTPARAREWALDSVASETQQKVAGNAYPALYGVVGNFVQGWDFTNLLGAMWLQMFWLLTASKAPRRCRNWECDNIIAYEQPDQPTQSTKKNDRSGGYRTRVDKSFCSKKCSNRYNYLTRTKPRRQRRGA